MGSVAKLPFLRKSSLLAVVILTGCFPEVSLNQGGTACKADSECAPGTVCVSGACAPVSQDGAVQSDGASAGPPECQSVNDCAGGEKCIDGKCLLTCGAIFCRKGQTCIEGACFIKCLGAKECQGFGLCDEGLCTIPASVQPSGGEDGGISPPPTDGGPGPGDSGGANDVNPADVDRPDSGDAGADDRKPTSFCIPACNVPNAESECVNSTCQIKSCMKGFVDLDKDPKNGCEYQCTPTGPDICDTRDNNCNGVVDDGIDKNSDPKNCKTCGNACPERPNTQPVCNRGECGFVCKTGFFDNDRDPGNGCESSNCAVSNGGVEICDGRDNDCNGVVDDNFDKNKPEACGDACVTCSPIGPNTVPACKDGRCVQGTCAPGFVDSNRDPSDGCELNCSPTIDPTERCDGVDNDCNPATLDGAADSRVGKACDTGKHGICKDGAGACINGQFQCVQTTQPKPSETCNNLDDDCNGLIDDNASGCTDGKFCQAGSCTNNCSNECQTEGEKKCEGNQVRVCGNFDSDPCLEWGLGPLCSGIQICSGGSCVDSCQHTCPSNGAKQCKDSTTVQTCGPNYDPDLCNEWGGDTKCSTGYQCSNGQCVCTDDCGPEGSKRCTTSGQVETCGRNYDSDTCLEWGGATSCPAETVCNSGNCVCVDLCTTAGAKRCNTSGQVETCGTDYDGDKCLEWGGATACPTGQACNNGVCALTCSDECASGQKRCNTSNQVESCGNYDGDACLEWGGAIGCGAGETCSSGQCVCVDQCTPENSKRCNTNGQVETCGRNYDSDTCLEWGGATACPTGQSCSGGVCGVVCSNECTSGAKRCNASGQVETCGNYDIDLCTEWGGAASCPTGQTCSGGVCQSSCTNACTKGQKRCNGSSTAETCDDYNGDGCTEWGGSASCPSGTQCESGDCRKVACQSCTQGSTTECLSSLVCARLDISNAYRCRIPCSGNGNCSSIPNSSCRSSGAGKYCSCP
ncbi:MAG: hypothetical protein GMKNLPBB_02456 [Myxococcota bacterium]|nr:hypothetical protein [Myxococcota bacterium]